MTLFRLAESRVRGLRALFATASPSGASIVGSIPVGERITSPPSLETEPIRPASRLSDLKPGESGTVSNLLGNAQGRLRLMEMGLTPGATVEVVHAAAFGGPLHICVRGYRLSLRRAEASAVVLGDR